MKQNLVNKDQSSIDTGRFSIQSKIYEIRGQHSKYLPFTFTELGVSMLSSVLNSETAIEINISIMRAFVAARLLLSNPPRLAKRQLRLTPMQVQLITRYLGEP